MALHQCSTCGQTCKPFRPKKDLDPTKRDRGTRCSGCNTRAINHADTCPIHLASRARLLATTPADMADTPRWLLDLMSPIPYHKDRAVGGVLFGRVEDAQAMRAQQDAYSAAQDAARLAHDAWSAQWRAVAEVDNFRD
jgi:DNA-directed RNA polymerase subunit RPC12/RpoP